MKTLIKNVRIVTDRLTDGSLLLENGKILAVLPVRTEEPADEVIDGKGLFASPGLIELHTHGSGGHDYMDGTQEAYNGAAEMQLAHGVTTLLPTTTAASTDEYLRTIDAFATAREARKDRQCLYGLHLEGPFFPLQRAGGMDERFLSDPNPALYEKLIEYRPGAIARWSSAPELPGTEAFGDYCLAHNVFLSIAHTDATIREVKRAMEHGFTHITHLYSDMSTITRESGFRILGVLECAYALDDLWVEVITDGCHLPPDLYRMIYKLIGPERLQICSDSIRPAGTGETENVIVGSLESGVRGIIEDGVAKFPDRSAFYGAIALGNDLVRVAHKKAGIPLPQAIRMMTENPAKILGIQDRKGRIAPGLDADILLFDENIDIRRVIYGGKTVIAQEA
ncbi:MAG: amidohydrolase family protein [Lachnospiraceae bacterium]|nr:amidohydrolase family protein [Lachnospiraceae bacterium]